MPALDDPHGGIAGQLATEFQFGLEIGDLLLQEAGPEALANRLNVAPPGWPITSASLKRPMLFSAL